MTRLSQRLVNHYPRKFLWWMECDNCNRVGGDPKWSCDDLELEAFRDQGWRCGDFDTCPECLKLETP
jgi:hypothetical protein